MPTDPEAAAGRSDGVTLHAWSAVLQAVDAEHALAAVAKLTYGSVPLPLAAPLATHPNAATHERVQHARARLFDAHVARVAERGRDNRDETAATNELIRDALANVDATTATRPRPPMS